MIWLVIELVLFTVLSFMCGYLYGESNREEGSEYEVE